MSVSAPVSDAVPPAVAAPTARALAHRRARRLFWFALVGLVAITAACILGPMLLDASRGQQALGDRLMPPAWLPDSLPGRLLGTDAFGRDLLYRTLEGGRVSLLVGFGAATGSVAIGATLGLAAGWRGGWLDRVVGALADVWLAFPFLVIALAAVAVLGSDVQVLIGLLTLGGWVLPTRVTRTVVRRVRGDDHVAAARGAGASDAYILRRHILPEIVPANIVVWSFTVGTLVVIEGALSFLGLGVKPPLPSWGSMLNSGTTFLQTAWWIALWPGLMLVLTVLATNGVGTGLRRMLDLSDTTDGGGA